MKPSETITDRAKRYRANNDVPEGPRVCLFCGSKSDLGVDHIDGFEEHGEPENLMWLCRSCNQKKSNVYLEAGLGRRTVQYNPGLISRLFGSKETYHGHGAAHPSVRREIAHEKRAERDRLRQEILEARKQEIAERREALAMKPKPVARYKGFTVYKRGSADDPADFRRYYSSFDPDSWFETSTQAKRLIDHYKNPARDFAVWRWAVRVLKGEEEGSPFKAARVIRSTPVARRYEYAARMNPGVIPTYEQYGWAVSQHCGGGRGSDAHCGAHDEGGAIIHATPKSKRREYARKIADAKRARRDEVPF